MSIIVVAVETTSSITIAEMLTVIWFEFSLNFEGSTNTNSPHEVTIDGVHRGSTETVKITLGLIRKENSLA